MLWVMSGGSGTGGHGKEFLARNEPPQGLPRWVARVLPMCQNLTALYLSRVELAELPALPLLAHLILEHLYVRPALVASLQGLARLETLHVSGYFLYVLYGTGPPVWDVRACTRLRRLYLSQGLACGLAKGGQALGLPPACLVALRCCTREEFRPWLVRLGWRLVHLPLEYMSVDEVAAGTSLMHAPRLSQLRHVSLCVMQRGKRSSLIVAGLLGGLPQCVESLYLHYNGWSSEQTSFAVPASLRALRIECFPELSGYGQACCDASSKCKQSFTFGLHAGLERLCLVLCESRVRLRCLDAGAPAGLRGLHVRARVVDMDAHLAAEVAQRGRVLERCSVERWQGGITYDGPPMRVVAIGQGPGRWSTAKGRKRHWPCTCGACAECLGPAAFGGVQEEWLEGQGLRRETFRKVPAMHDSSL